MVEERRLFKDYFDRQAAQALAQQIARAHRSFDQRAFVKAALVQNKKLEMMDRVRQWSTALRQHLPSDTAKALAILERSLPSALPDASEVTHGFVQWPIGQFIADYGLEAPDAAFDIMPELTKRFSSEFAIRPFVAEHPERTFAACLRWSSDENVHVRRLASEGIRPRLPWGAVLRSLVEDPSPILPVLENLKDDPEDYVRRSVANNLNDIAKDHPQVVLATCRRWKAGATEERRWIIRRALRSQVKAGSSAALSILGFAAPKQLEAGLQVSPKSVPLGESIALELSLLNGAARKQKLLVDFRIHYAGKDGPRKPKVFKWKELTLGKGQSTTLQKRVRMEPRSIRKLYPGKHVVDIQVNGSVLASGAFRLVG